MIREGDRVLYSAPDGVRYHGTCTRVWSHAEFPLINIAYYDVHYGEQPVIPKHATSIAHKSAVPGAASKFWEHA